MKKSTIRSIQTIILREISANAPHKPPRTRDEVLVSLVNRVAEKFPDEPDAVELATSGLCEAYVKQDNRIRPRIVGRVHRDSF